MLGGYCVFKGLSAKDELGMWAGKEEKGLEGLNGGNQGAVIKEHTPMVTSQQIT